MNIKTSNGVRSILAEVATEIAVKVAERVIGKAAEGLLGALHRAPQGSRPPARMQSPPGRIAATDLNARMNPPGPAPWAPARPFGQVPGKPAGAVPAQTAPASPFARPFASSNRQPARHDANSAHRSDEADSTPAVGVPERQRRAYAMTPPKVAPDASAGSAKHPSPWHDALNIGKKTDLPGLQAKARSAVTKADARKVLDEFAGLRREVVNKAGGLLKKHAGDEQATGDIKKARASAFMEIDTAVAAVESELVHKDGVDPRVAPKVPRQTTSTPAASTEAVAARLGITDTLAAAGTNRRAFQVLGYRDPGLDIHGLNATQLTELMAEVKTLHKKRIELHPDKNEGDAVATGAMAMVNDAISHIRSVVATKLA